MYHSTRNIRLVSTSLTLLIQRLKIVKLNKKDVNFHHIKLYFEQDNMQHIKSLLGHIYEIVPCVLPPLPNWRPLSYTFYLLGLHALCAF